MRVTLTTAILTAVFCDNCVLGTSSQGDSGSSSAAGTADGGTGSTAGTAIPGGTGSTAGATNPSGGTTSGGVTVTSGGSSAGTDPSGQTPGFTPAGWLYTKGNHIYLSDGTQGTPWMGRGTNLDDVFLCGYNDTNWDANSESELKSIVDEVMTWKPNFLRVSLSMKSAPDDTVSWIDDTEQYKTKMISVIDYIGATYPRVYVLVTLRSDATMNCQLEPTCLPTRDTSAVYAALVDAFAASNYILFGLANEPGGNGEFSDTDFLAALNTAANAIRAEENKLGVTHHIISTQGKSYAADLTIYTKDAGGSSPISADNVVYETHYYPSFGNDPNIGYKLASKLPVIVGEHGGTDSPFFTDMETLQIPNLAWDYEPMSNCGPDLVNSSPAKVTNGPTDWGNIEKAYLLAHAL